MPLERLFTTGSLRPQDSMRFVLAGSAQEPLRPAFTVPEHWPLECAQAFAQALCTDRPAATHAIEENTLPSWLWQRRAIGEERCAETSVMEIFNRIAGATTYRGWKLGLWQNEVEASTFFDELHALLLTRRLILSPAAMAQIGLDWAYGLTARATTPTEDKPQDALILQNETIDGILRRTHPTAHNKWTSFFESRSAQNTSHFAFVDTMAEWGPFASPKTAPRAQINMLAFRTADGLLDHLGLQQAARLGTLFLEINYERLSANTAKDRPLALGFCNMAALLMSLGQAYDSDAARGTAASLCAILTATAEATSAKLAHILGSCEAFGPHREIILRRLRNRLRATFGEQNDYEHLSILPHTLRLDSGADLSLISTARYACEEALSLVQTHGLRHLQVTAPFEEADTAAISQACTQDTRSEPVLTCTYAVGDDLFQKEVRPCVMMGLEKLGYDEADRKAMHDHLIGYRTLIGAPVINQATLQDLGFDDAALAKIEALLPFVDHLRFAITPWVIGIRYCQEQWGISPTDSTAPGFDLLRHLGFSSQDIAIANASCCGHASLRGIGELAPEHAPVFETQQTMDATAHLMMAAAIQPFICGDIALAIEIPASLSADLRGALVLQAWQAGMKSLTLQSDAPYRTTAPSVEDGIIKRQSERLSERLAAPPAPLSGNAPSPLKPKAASRTVSMASAERSHDLPRTKQRT